MNQTYNFNCPTNILSQGTMAEAQPDNHPCSTSSQNGSLLFLKVPTSAFLAQLRDSLYRLGQYNLCSADNDQKMHFNHKYIVLEHLHTDFEISASAGYLLHLIDCFCRILHLPTKYMLFAMGSRSHFRDRSNLDLYNLFPGISPNRKKSRGYVPAVKNLISMPKAAPDRRGSLESRCSSATAASVATISTMASLVGLEASYNFQDWVRLREICNAISASRESLTEQSSGLEKAVEEQNSFGIRNAKQEDSFAASRRAYRKNKETHPGFAISPNECDGRRQKQAKEMEQNVAIMEDEIGALNHTTSEMRSTYTPLRNELVLRRRFAINELRRIYFPSEIDMSDQETTFFNGTKRTCYCKRQDTIRANHLPIHLPASKDAKIVHTDFEISASAGYLLHLIDCFCRILHLPTKYMLFAMGSRSHFRDRSNLDLYNLFPGISPKRKKSRDYVPAVYFLDKSLPIAVFLSKAFSMSSPITNCDLERPTTSSQHADMDDADEEEVLIEPRFKYSRTLNDVSKVRGNFVELVNG
ncbi:hypothetical protein DdX_19826 [Ditylenchus destructor]|uniref:Uncharacterized protein n=1 Tax=Ditylenchus destructor TaxID=166010 RepID=A0AAD4QWX9_9BILA|nr:hypothetical protein DdX_19826 [Ditylenchus destructor]